MNPSLADIAKAVNQVHACVDGFRAEQAKVNKDAAKRRHDMANELVNLQGDIRAVKADVAGVKDQQSIADGRISRLAKTFGAEAWAPGEIPVKPKGPAGWGGWNIVFAGFSSMSGAILAYKVFEPVIEPIIKAVHHAIMTAH